MTDSYGLFDDLDAPLPNESMSEAKLPPMTPVQKRIIQAHDEEPSDPAYLHTVMCQTSMPYRRTAERRWQHRNGNALLQIEAGSIIDPKTDDFADVPLPWGPKPRLVLAHLNGEALRQGSRYIDVEGTLHGFSRRIMGYAPNGKEMRAMREHLASLSVATVRLAVKQANGRRDQVQDNIVRGLSLWDHGDERQATLWPAQVVFSEMYWKNLSDHAVPLDPRHIGALSHSAMALDIYSWLAQRLHRIRQVNGQFVPWARLHQQFGHGYKQINGFRRVFRRELNQVTGVYQHARLGEEIDKRGHPLGLRLEHSKPPVLTRG